MLYKHAFCLGRPPRVPSSRVEVARLARGCQARNHSERTRADIARTCGGGYKSACESGKRERGNEGRNKAKQGCCGHQVGGGLGRERACGGFRRRKLQPPEALSQPQPTRDLAVCVLRRVRYYGRDILRSADCRSRARRVAISTTLLRRHGRQRRSHRQSR